MKIYIIYFFLCDKKRDSMRFEKFIQFIFIQYIYVVVVGWIGVLGWIGKILIKRRKYNDSRHE